MLTAYGKGIQMVQADDGTKGLCTNVPRLFAWCLINNNRLKGPIHSFTLAAKA